MVMCAELRQKINQRRRVRVTSNRINAAIALENLISTCQMLAWMEIEFPIAQKLLTTSTCMVSSLNYHRAVTSTLSSKPIAPGTPVYKTCGYKNKTNVRESQEHNNQSPLVLRFLHRCLYTGACTMGPVLGAWKRPIMRTTYVRTVRL